MDPMFKCNRGRAPNSLHSQVKDEVILCLPEKEGKYPPAQIWIRLLRGVSCMCGFLERTGLRELPLDVATTSGVWDGVNADFCSPKTDLNYMLGWSPCL